MSKIEILGVPIDPWRFDDLAEQVLAWARDGEDRRRTVLYANAHVLNTACANTALLREMRRATTVYCDGSGVRLAAALLGRSLPERMTGADWIYPFCERASREGTSVFLLGGQDGVADRAAQKLRDMFPGLRIAGTHTGYFADERQPAVVDAINRSAAKVVLVGMGTPRQELWIGENRERLSAPVVWAVGALFDFVAGVQSRGPRWVVEHNLEWLGRLISDPGRLWKRYVIGNPLFLMRVLRQRLAGSSVPTPVEPPDVS